MSIRVWAAAAVLFSFVFSVQVRADDESAPKKKKWSILIFLNADNNLERFGFMDVQEMESVAPSDDVNVVVQFDELRKLGTKRFLVEKSDRVYSGSYDIHSPVLEQMPEQDMGDPEVLKNFIQWAVEKFPAENYALILWNHGSGWKKDDETNATKGISYDDTSNNHITTLQLADVLKSSSELIGGKFGVLAFDACLMAMAEVADGYAPYAKYMVGSEETIPGKGFPYDKLLEAFAGHDSKDAKTLAQDMVREYGLSYSGGSQGTSNVTLSAMDLSEMNNLRYRVQNWVNAADTKSGFARQDFLEEAKQAQAYDDTEYRDLGDYVVRLMSRRINQDESADTKAGFLGASLALLDAIDRVVIEKFNSKIYEKSRGISIYLPYVWATWSPWNSSSASDQKMKEVYKSLSFLTATPWASHLDKIFP